jgi:hypothetical protein
MAVTDGRTARERPRDELAAARAACDGPEVRRKLDAVDELLTQLPPTPLIEYPDCEVAGLP